jgi:hypothetical protein
VLDKDRANFCEYYAASTSAAATTQETDRGRASGTDAGGAARAQLEALFRKKKT